MTPRLEPAGDQGLYVRFGDDIDPAVNDRVLAAVQRLAQGRPAGVLDVVPAYTCLLVIFDALAADGDDIAAWITTALDGDAPPPRSRRTVEVPVFYDARVAPDLDALAQAKGLTAAELVQRHVAPVYRCHALGFRPGFPFLGGLDPLLASPRLATPRLRVPAGAVGIGGRQTGVYPLEGPGGWHLIGRTPLALFDPARPDPFLVHAGDDVRFVAIDEAAYLRSGGRLAAT